MKKTEVALDVLAAQINAAHRKVEQGCATMLDAARQAGELLARAKAGLKHGEWLPWLARNFHGSERTAHGYLRIHRHWSDLAGANPQRAADLTSVRAAIALLTDETKATPDELAEMPEEERDKYYASNAEALDHSRPAREEVFELLTENPTMKPTAIAQKAAISEILAANLSREFNAEKLLKETTLTDSEIAGRTKVPAGVVAELREDLERKAPAPAKPSHDGRYVTCPRCKGEGKVQA